MNEAYEKLAASIIEQALRDYRHARKNILQKYDVINSGSRIREIQRFLKSSWFRLLSDLDGEKLIELMEGEFIMNVIFFTAGISFFRTKMKS